MKVRSFARGAALFAGALAVAATSLAQINVGGIQALTGPQATNAALLKGAEARFNAANAAGGVRGHKIEFHAADDQNDPALTPGLARDLVEKKEAVILVGTGSAPSAAIGPYLKAQKVVNIPASGSTALIADKQGTTRLVLSAYDRLVAQVVQHAVKKLGKKRVAIAYTEDAIGEPSLAGAKAALEGLGMNLVEAVAFNPRDVQTAAQSAKLKASNADFVVINYNAGPASVVIKSNERLGFKPDYGLSYPAVGPAIVELTGGAIDGRAYFSTPLVTTSSREAQAYQEWSRKAGADPDNALVLLGWTVADAAVAVLDKAVQDAGGKAPTREQVLAAASNISIDTPYVRGLKWTATEHGGTAGSQIVKLIKSKFESDAPFETLPVLAK